MAFDEFGQWYDDYLPEDDPGRGLSEFERDYGQIWTGDFSDATPGDIRTYESQGAVWPGERPTGGAPSAPSSNPTAPSGDGGGWPSPPGAFNWQNTWGNAPRPDLPSYEKPPPFQYDPYTAPAPFAYDDWKAPSVDEVMADPSYQWRKGQGEQSLQRWAAARGTLNSSDTATALMDYGQNAASQEYGNVWNRNLGAYQTNRKGALDTYNVNEGNRFKTYGANRAGALQTYNTNYQTQYTDPYRYEYQTAMDNYQPQLMDWQSERDFGMQQQAFGAQDQWSRYLAELDQERWEREFGLNVASTD